MELKIETQVVSLNSVLTFYARGFTPPQGEILKWDAYTDTAQGKVVFQLFVDLEGKARNLTSLSDQSDNQRVQVSEQAKDELKGVLERIAREAGVINPARVAQVVQSSIDAVASELSEEIA